MDYYLQFESEAAANAVLFTTHPAVLEEDGVTVTEEHTTPNYANIDTIGVIYKPTGETLQGEDGEGNVVSSPAMAPAPGWHVNVRLVDGEDAEALEPFKVDPATPVRVWG